jgi:hypothetical protein
MLVLCPPKAHHPRPGPRASGAFACKEPFMFALGIVLIVVGLVVYFVANARVGAAIAIIGAVLFLLGFLTGSSP